jgi:CRISPR/Cas system-associated endoribonuclease Cas2
MPDKEMIKITVEEFSRVQNYMLLCEKNSEAYKVIKQRYTELKVILTSSGVNLSELDIIKE